MNAPIGIDSLASETKFLSIGIFCGLIPVKEASEWADAKFHGQASPPSWLMEIAFASKEPSLVLVGKLDVIAQSLGVTKLREAEVRRLLDRLVQAIDAKKFSPREAEFALRWVGENAPSNDTLALELLVEESRFHHRWQRDGELQYAWSDLRGWLVRARRDPSTAE